MYGPGQNTPLRLFDVDDGLSLPLATQGVTGLVDFVTPEGRLVFSLFNMLGISPSGYDH